jgi:ribonuclease HI
VKYYAVKAGREVGVFDNWADCQTSITGYSGAEYKSFGNSSVSKDFTKYIVIRGGTFDTTV